VKRAILITTLLLVIGTAISVGRDRTNRRYLSPHENDIVRELNLARTHPEKYAEYIGVWARHYEGNLRKLPGRTPVRTREGVEAVDEAIIYLNSIGPLEALRSSEGMSRGARDHVRDLGPEGRFGHIGSDESTTGNRVNRYGTWHVLIGENIAYGSESARDIVAQLIVDDGVPGRGHRANIFDPRFGVVGVAFGHHNVYESMCVITFAGDYVE
jgi:uncharacterized protein YkwD